MRPYEGYQLREGVSKVGPNKGWGAARQGARDTPGYLLYRQPGNKCAVAPGSNEARCAILLECRKLDGAGFLDRRGSFFRNNPASPTEPRTSDREDVILRSQAGDSASGAKIGCGKPCQ